MSELRRTQRSTLQQEVLEGLTATFHQLALRGQNKYLNVLHVR